VEDGETIEIPVICAVCKREFRRAHLSLHSIQLPASIAGICAACRASARGFRGKAKTLQRQNWGTRTAQGGMASRLVRRPVDEGVAPAGVKGQPVRRPEEADS
jgi:hypothetical protein